MKVIVSFSGGKDSQACLIWAVNKYGKENVEAVFCDTGWEHPDTYKHIEKVINQLGLKLIVIKNEKVGGFEQLCKGMKCFPVATRRACTSQLKVRPMIDWILQQNENLLIIQGIRGGESKSRSMMDIECSYFAEYFSDSNKKVFRKRDVLKWCKKYDASVLRPLFHWSAQEVVDYIIESKTEINPLYKKGASRVGCFPCIMARHGDIKLLSSDKEMFDRVYNLEKEVDHLGDGNPAVFFSRGIIPERFCREIGNGYPTITDVVNYVTRNDDIGDLFEPDEGYSCMSIYHGLCE